jgi:hypothetical protein
MRFVRCALVVLGSLVVIAATSAAASAEAPEFGRCVKQAGGRYANAGCTATVAGSQRYEWEPGPGPKPRFTQKLSGTKPFKWKLASNDEGVCSGESATGEYTGTKTLGGVHIVFTGCEFGFPGYRLPCGTVSIAPMRGELGVYKTGETQALDKLGVKLSPEAGSQLTELECGISEPTRMVWRGGFVIGELPANQMALKPALSFHQRHASSCIEEQIPASFVGETPSPLESTHNCFIGQEFGPMGWQMSSNLFNEERLEANSVL